MEADCSWGSARIALLFLLAGPEHGRTIPLANMSWAAVPERSGLLPNVLL